jgi:hypothetical protein
LFFIFSLLRLFLFLQPLIQIPNFGSTPFRSLKVVTTLMYMSIGAIVLLVRQQSFLLADANAEEKKAAARVKPALEWVEEL